MLTIAGGIILAVFILANLRWLLPLLLVGGTIVGVFCLAVLTGGFGNATAKHDPPLVPTRSTAVVPVGPAGSAPGPAGALRAERPLPAGYWIDANLDQLMKDPDFLEMMGIRSGPATRRPNGGAYRLGNVPVIDPVPSGITARYEMAEVDRQLDVTWSLGKPAPANFSAAKTMFNNGVAIGSDGRGYRVQNGVLDPARP